MSAKTTKPASDKPEGYVFGRPTKYKPEYAKMLIDFMNREVVKEIKTVTSGSGKGGSEWSREEVRYEALDFPTIELFANEIGVHDATLWDWASEKYPADHTPKKLAGTYRHPDFHDAYTRAKRIQRGLVVKYGMIGKLNPGFAQFFAINNLDMVSAKTQNTNEDTLTHRFEDMDDDELDRRVRAIKGRKD